jgi:hypothetical protein
MEKEEEDLQKELGALSPHLPPKQINPPPDGNFDGLPEKVIQRWNNEMHRSQYRYVVLWRSIAIAVTIVGLVLGLWWMAQPSVTKDTSPVLALNSSEAYEYVIENINDFEGLIDYIELPTEDNINIPDSSSIQEYLLEELDGNELEEIF